MAPLMKVELIKARRADESTLEHREIADVMMDDARWRGPVQMFDAVGP